MKPHHIRITIPSTSKVGDEIRAIVDVRNPDETTSKFFYGRVVFDVPDGIEMPSEHVIEKGSGGRFTIEKIKLLKPGIFRIGASFRKGAISGTSNPIEVTRSNPDFGLYWGDIHLHTALSDGSGTPESCYEYARDVSGLDICAMTDHDVYPELMDDKLWAATTKAAQKYNDPGRFVTFLGYEWTAGEYFTKGPHSGHHCVYFLDDYARAKYYHCSNPDTNTPEKLWAKYDPKKVMTIVHHTAVNSPTFWYDYSHRNDAMQTLVEVYSTWGSSELADKRRNARPIRRCGGMVPKRSGKTVQEALAKGFRLGLIGGSDGHDGRPGDSNAYVGDPPLTAYEGGVHQGHFYPGGLMAVYSEGLTRESVWEAMRKRRVYATTGARIIMSFKINGHMMGEEITLTKHQDVAIHLDVAGTARIRKIDIIRSNKQIYSVAPRSTEASLTYLDREKVAGPNFYYIRVTQQDGNIAWSSPIWVDRPHTRLSRVRDAIKARGHELIVKRDTRKAKKKAARTTRRKSGRSGKQ